MSDERREQRPRDDRLPGEENLSTLYQQAEKDPPPPNLDAAVLDAARQAVRSQPRRVYFFPSRKWVMPLSLAAALWVTIEVIMMQRNEEPKFRINAPPPTMQAESDDATRHRTGRPPVAAPLSSAPSQETMSAQSEQAETLPKETLRAKSLERDVPTRFAGGGEKEEQTVRRSQAAKPAAKQMLQDRREGPKEKAGSVSDLPGATPALAPPSTSAPGATRSITAEARKEQTLSPEAWVAKIKELHRAGKHAEAEENLKAFKERYPDYPVEKVLGPTR